MKKSRIVVTGGTGFVGSRVVEACREAGWDTVSCSRREGVDLRDGGAFGDWLAKTKPSIVVHCAAHVGGIGYVAEHGVEVFEDNLAISTGLLHGLRATGVKRLVTVMPNCTYPGDKTVYRESQWWDGPIHDSVLMYGLPRKVLWGLCKTYGDDCGLGSAHLIFPNQYGPGDHFDPVRSHALGALVAKIVDAKDTNACEVEIWGSGRPIREWLYVDDAAEAVVRFLPVVDAQPALLGNHPILNIGQERGVTIAALAQMIADAVGWQGRLVFNESRPDGAQVKTLDGELFRDLCSWEPRTTLQEGISKTLAWYQSVRERELVHAN